LTRFFVKVIACSADKQNESKMLPTLTTVTLPQIYCRACHLATRSDVMRCLHCNKPLTQPVSAPKRPVQRLKARRTR
jgi:hypothetical protein